MLLLTLILLFIGCQAQNTLFNPDIENPTNGKGEEFPVLFSPAPDNTWTFMIYMDGANNLESEAIKDFNEMEYGLYLANQQNPGILDNLNVIVLFDRMTGFYVDAANDWTNTRLYKILPDNAQDEPRVSGELYDPFGNYGFALDALHPVERNMGDRNTLRDFLDYAATYYPADHLALVIWDHGSGPLASLNNVVQVTSRAIAIDNESPGMDSLSTEEFCNAIAGSIALTLNGKLDLVAFDACLMGSVEIAYELRNVADYMAGSMAEEWIKGWDYSNLFGSMNSPAGSADSRELAKLIVKMYRDITVNIRSTETMSAVDLSRMEALKTALDDLAAAMHQENKKAALETLRNASYGFFDPSSESEVMDTPYFDINDFCYKITGNNHIFTNTLVTSALNVINQLGIAVAAAYGGSKYGSYYGIGNTVKRGLYIVFPAGDRTLPGTPPVSYYHFAGWYTNVLLQSLGEDGSYMGHLDFCSCNNNGVVESWVELLDAWYDPENDQVVWNSF